MPKWRKVCVSVSAIGICIATQGGITYIWGTLRALHFGRIYVHCGTNEVANLFLYRVYQDYINIMCMFNHGWSDLMSSYIYI